MRDMTPPQKKAPKPVRKKPAYTENDIDYDYERSVQFANRGCLVSIVVMLLVVAVVALWGYLFISAEISGEKATATGAIKVEIPLGSGAQTIGKLLEEKGMIGDGRIFRFYVSFTGKNTFQNGMYELTPGMNYDEIIVALSEDPPLRETMKITFPEGSTVIQFARICEEKGLFTAQEFIDAANNVELYQDIEFFKHIEYTPDTWMKGEGYLLPATYDVYVDESPESVVRRLYVYFNASLEDMTFVTESGEIGFYDRLAQQGLSLQECITLASIVEEEASNPDENQAKVAGVFYNRLKREDMPWSELPRRTLGSDVTFYYVRDFIARDYNNDYDAVPWEWKYAYLALDDPELREGLPVGPISSPAPHTIRAVLQPNGEDYFYFLTDFYGNYYYAETYAGHQKNITTMETQNAKYKEENPEEGEG